MERTEIRFKTIESYECKIAWAKGQGKDTRVDEDVMLSAIGESWHGRNCLYCTEYYVDEDCSKCPLSVYEANKVDDELGYYPSHCCNCLWREMDDTTNWGGWVDAAQKVLTYIRTHG
jgi:hypothetical protein